MVDPQLLVVEPDPSARGLILSGLRRQGLSAIGAQSGYEALGRLDDVTPTLVVSEVGLPDLPGTELLRRLRSRRPTAEVPFYFLTGSEALDVDAARGCGAQDLLRKPAFVSDLATLARLHAGRPAQASLLGGQLEAVGLAHLLRALASGGRSGRVVILEGEGEVRFHRGRIVDAVFRDRSGERALLRLLTLTRGPFEIAFDATSDEDLSDEDLSYEGELNLDVTQLLAHGFPHVRRWEQIVASLYPLEAALVVDYGALATRLEELPDAVNPVLRLFDGRRSIEAVIESSGLPDLVALEVVGKLDSLGLLHPASGGPVSSPVAVPPVANPASDEGVETPAADEMLQSLFVGAAPPEGAAVAAAVPQISDWWEDYVKGADPWSDILPDLPEAESPWAGHVECEAILDALTAGTVSEALARVPLGESDAPDLLNLRETPVERPRREDRGPEIDADSGPIFDETADAFFAESESESEPESEPEAMVEAPLDEALMEAPRPFPIRAFVLGATAVLLMGTALLISSRLPTGDDVALMAAAPSDAGAGVAGAEAADVGQAENVADVADAAMAGEVAEVASKDVVALVALEDAAIEGDSAETTSLSRLLDRGQAAYDRGRLDEARRAFREAAVLDPDNVTAQLGLGLAALDAGGNTEAVEALRAARRLDPASDRAAVLLGTALQIRGDRAGAAAAYRAYLELAPDGTHAGEVRRILAGW